MTGPYVGARFAAATRHGKTAAWARPFADHLGAELVTPDDLDTDALGTFTGEVERVGTMREIAVAKARMGMAATGLPFGLASEGTFGPHPSIPYLASGSELLVFVDDQRGIVVVEALVTEETNFASATAEADDDLTEFLADLRFPDHRVIVRPETGAGPIVKDLCEEAAVRRALAALGGRGRIETDMRADRNPTRMTILGRLGEALARRIATPCPACGAPGYGRMRVEAGLPCGDCGAPTALVRAEIFGCVACDHQESRPRADGLSAAEPGLCPICNP